MEGANETLCCAAEKGQLDVMRRAYEERGATYIDVALCWAAESGQLAAMRLLHDEWGATDVNDALLWAAGHGKLDAMHLLHDEWGASLSAFAGETLEDYSRSTRDLLEQWTQPLVKSALKQ